MSGILDVFAFCVFLVMMAIVTAIAPLLYLWFTLTADRMIDGDVAKYTVYVYCGLSILATIVLFVRPTAEGLPVGWQLFSLAYLAKQKKYVASASFDASKFVERSPPSTLYGTRMITNVYRETSTLLKRRSRRMDAATADYLKAEQTRADDAVDMAKAEAVKQAAETWKKKDEHE